MLEDIARFQHDPLGYVLYAFPWGEAGELADKAGPYRWQREILTEIGKRLRAGADARSAIQMAIASGHGIGKSALVAWITLWAMSTHEDTRGVVTANTEAQLTTKTWPELAKWHRSAINKHWFTFTATAIFSADPGHEKTWRFDAVPWTEHRSEAFAGLHNEGGRIVLIFDEASAITDKIWEVAEGALTDKNTEILWLAFGNPTRASGRFRECFRRYSHRWQTRNIDSRTVEGTNKDQLAKWVADYGEDSDFVKVRVRGLFPSASFKQFISEADIDKGYGKHLQPGQYSWAPKIISVDPAWSGDDELVIGMRQGLLFSVLKIIPKNDNDVAVANIVARFEDEHGADAVFIDGGFGTGIVSAGRTMNREHWQLVWFGEASSDEGCINKRAEMWLAMRDWLKQGGAIPADPTLRQDIAGPETVPRLDGKIQLESKEDMKRRGVPSPNRADALALTFAYPVELKDRDEETARRLGVARRRSPAEFAEHDYNPLKRGT